MTKKYFIVLILCTFILSGCMFIPDKPARVMGSGNVVSETRPVSGIKSIALQGSADVNVKFGTAESLSISGEDNIIFLIETNVQNHQLAIKTRPLMTYTATHPVRVDVTVVSLDGISISGSGNMDVSGYTGNSLTIGLPGSGTITVAGSTDRTNITLDGSGNIYADQLIAKTASVSLKGSGNVKVYASDLLDATLPGSGNIRYFGNPAKVNSKVTGSGNIEP